VINAALPGGAYTIEATSCSGLSTTTGDDTFTYAARPAGFVVYKLTTPAGPLTPHSVTITGGGFKTGDKVLFGGVRGSTVKVVTTHTIRASTPGAKPSTVTVTFHGQSVVVGQYTCDPFPTLKIVSPHSGRTSGGTTVTLTGSGFVTGATAVEFGQSAGTTVTVLGPTQLTVRTTSHSAGRVGVTVATPGGRSGAVVFTYAKSVCRTARADC
jgi:hypothetical protein